MPGPGEYVPDPTEGITRVEDLPKPRVRQLSRDRPCRRCPRCRARAGRHALGRRTLHDLGDSRSERPAELVVKFSRHRCLACGLCFDSDLSSLALPYCRYTLRVQRLAVRLVADDGMPYRDRRRMSTYGATIASSSPSPPSRTGSRRRGKKCRQAISGTFLDEALVGFSGYLAVDEVYDGPFCVLCVVDNRAFNRLACAVLDHAPRQEDVLAFLAGFKDRTGATRHRQVAGLTTDGSQLYPKALAELWPDAPHQVCEFHVIKEITKAVLHALAAMRKQMRAEIPKRGRGRPAKAERVAAGKAARKEKRVSDLFEHRHLFVRHWLSPAQKRELHALTRGLPRLRVLRGIMDEVYRLFDRRCKTETALAKLETLRRRVRRFKSLGKALDKLKSPTLEKALVFLDDKLLPSTSNAVERSNRRFRKAQRAVYGARTKTSLEQRIALDMHREQRLPGRRRVVKTLHCSRSKGR